MDKKIKTIHDVFKLGSRAVINNQDYQLEEIMIWGTAEIIYTILRFIAKNGKNIVCSVDIETNEIMLLSSEQSTLYHENLNMHKERLVKTDSAGILNYKANSHRTENKVAIEKIIKQRNVKWVTLKHLAKALPDLLETADLESSSCREFLLAVLETEVVGRNERRRKRNYSAAHFPPNIRPLEEFDPEELDSGITQAQLDKLKGLS